MVHSVDESCVIRVMRRGLILEFSEGFPAWFRLVRLSEWITEAIEFPFVHPVLQFYEFPPETRPQDIFTYRAEYPFDAFLSAHSRNINPESVDYQRKMHDLRLSVHDTILADVDAYFTRWQVLPAQRSGCAFVMATIQCVLEHLGIQITFDDVFPPVPDILMDDFHHQNVHTVCMYLILVRVKLSKVRADISILPWRALQLFSTSSVGGFRDYIGEYHRSVLHISWSMELDSYFEGLGVRQRLWPVLMPFLRRFERKFDRMIEARSYCFHSFRHYDYDLFPFNPIDSEDIWWYLGLETDRMLEELGDNFEELESD